MTVDQLTIFVSLSAPGNHYRKVRRDVWCPTSGPSLDLVLNLAVFKLMLEVSDLKTGPEAPVTCVDMLPQEGVGQQRKLGEETKSMVDGNTVLVGDVPP